MIKNALKTKKVEKMQNKSFIFKSSMNLYK